MGKFVKDFLLIFNKIVAFLRCLRKMILGHFYWLKVCDIVPSADLDLAETLQETLKISGEVADFL